MVHDAIMVTVTAPYCGRHQHFYADTGHLGALTTQVIDEYGYMSHVRGRRQGPVISNAIPRGRAKHWSVAVMPSLFRRFRKLLVSNEMAVRSTFTLNHLVASIIVLRLQVFDTKSIYG